MKKTFKNFFLSVLSVVLVVALAYGAVAVKPTFNKVAVDIIINGPVDPPRPIAM